MTEITPFYQKNLECLSCKNSFRTTKIRSRFIKLRCHETDFRPVYQDEKINPLLYNVNVCPACGFSFTDDFNRYIVPALKTEIQEKLSAHWTEQDFGGSRSTLEAINTYKLAILSGTLKREKSVTMAGLYLRTAWLYRSIENEEQENRFMTLAMNTYITTYTNEDFAGMGMSETKILYLIAELQLRLQKYREAASYFSKVLSKQKNSLEPRIVEMARDRWQEMREDYRKAT
ncbi:DUF2225 domain-containing protein [Rossellomorea vietnamensis]|uniref:DUF2225 domain-containing protein n=1 Tax=Rossellomorea vietnamensis TaxID=218284 RepID=UPI003CEAA5CB